MPALLGSIAASLVEGARYVWIAALPVSELRGAIPLAIHAGMHPLEAFVLGVFGNLLPIVPLLWTFRPITAWLRERTILRRSIEWLWTRNLNKSRSIRTYGLIGLAVFVAVPAPGTGAWTGAMIASLLKMPLWPAAGAIAAGVLAAGVIVTLVSVLAL